MAFRLNMHSERFITGMMVLEGEKGEVMFVENAIPAKEWSSLNFCNPILSLTVCVSLTSYAVKCVNTEKGKE